MDLFKELKDLSVRLFMGDDLTSNGFDVLSAELKRLENSCAENETQAVRQNEDARRDFYCKNSLFNKPLCDKVCDFCDNPLFQ